MAIITDEESERIIQAMNKELEGKTPQERVEWLTRLLNDEIMTIGEKTDENE